LSSRQNPDEETVVRRNVGFTLLELVYTLALAGLVAGLGVPALERFMLDARMTADINALVTSIQLARSESTKRARPVIVCKTIDRSVCLDDTAGYESGWMVFVNEDDRVPPTRSPGEPLLFAHVPRLAGSIRSNRRLYEFRPFERRSTNGTVTFCDERGAAAAKAVVVSYTGRPRVATIGPGRRLLVCAGLP
jgi:type IV fimbrial biogenesis protein FimT